MIDPAILIALSGSVITLCAAGISVHRADKQRRFWRGEALAEAKNARDAINKADANEAIPGI